MSQPDYRVIFCEWPGQPTDYWRPGPWGVSAELVSPEGFVRQRSAHCFARTVAEARRLALADLASKLNGHAEVNGAILR